MAIVDQSTDVYSQHGPRATAVPVLHEKDIRDHMKHPAVATRMARVKKLVEARRQAAAGRSGEVQA